MVKTKNKEKKLNKKLIKAVVEYLDIYVKKPASETVEKDFHAQERLVHLLVLVRILSELIQKEGEEFDDEYLLQLPKTEIEKHFEVLNNFISSESSQQNQKLPEETIRLMKLSRSNKHLLAYFNRELNWIIISILSASYISAYILMRSVFELLIGISTKKTGSMKNKIESIHFLSQEEKKKIQKMWDHLCGWGHPYRKWEKEICPVYQGHTPLHHPTLCKECINSLDVLIELFFLITIDKFGINASDIIKAIEEHRIDPSTFPFIKNRT
ncbi:hypothetical protein BMS3Abin16_01492 [archaeon BMS3Abin16]|nr:hypothetical protein BMS3Abin16_01492 [archaeon BMS3Abin16]HDY74622.1 hypothetical protein [Euryarchaeota archaeon]